GGRWRAPALVGARRLVRASGPRGGLITILGASDGGPLGTTVVRYTARLLRRLGYDASTEIVPSSDFLRMPWQDIQLKSTDTEGSTPFFHGWLGCGAPFNNGWFWDPRLDREVAHADALETAGAHAAAAPWAKVGRQGDDAASVG